MKKHNKKEAKNITMTQWKSAWRLGWARLFELAASTRFQFGKGADTVNMSIEVPRGLYELLEAKYEHLCEVFPRSYRSKGETIQTGLFSKKEFINLLLMYSLNIEQKDGVFKESIGKMELYLKESAEELRPLLYTQEDEKRAKNREKSRKYRQKQAEERIRLEKEIEDLKRQLAQAKGNEA